MAFVKGLLIKLVKHKVIKKSESFRICDLIYPKVRGSTLSRKTIIDIVLVANFYDLVQIEPRDYRGFSDDFYLDDFLYYEKYTINMEFFNGN